MKKLKNEDFHSDNFLNFYLIYHGILFTFSQSKLSFQLKY